MAKVRVDDENFHLVLPLPAKRGEGRGEESVNDSFSAFIAPKLDEG